VGYNIATIVMNEAEVQQWSVTRGTESYVEGWILR